MCTIPSSISVTLLAGMWRRTENGKDVKKQVFRLTEDESEMALFKTKYNTTQKQLQAIAAMDDLLSGLLTIVYTYWRSFPFPLNCVLCKYL